MQLNFESGQLNQKKTNTASDYFPGLCVNKFFIFLIISITIFNSKSFGQTPVDSIEVHSAKKATIMSACLPGLGQAYNKKYWKIPVIYAGFGVLTYFMIQNGTEYRNFREAYIIADTITNWQDSDNSYVLRYEGNVTSLQEGRNYYRHNLELTYILSGLLYVLNIIDASVDANLYNFDVSDDLTLRFEPVSNEIYWARGPTPALTLRFKF
jgi:hypothetical protein